GARRRHPAGRYDPGLWRKILSARYAALRPERALDARCDAECRRTYFGGLADQYPDARPGVPAAEIVSLRRLDRDARRRGSPQAAKPVAARECHSVARRPSSAAQ